MYSQQKDYYTKFLEKGLESSFGLRKLNLINDVIDQDFKKKTNSHMIKTFIAFPFVYFGILKLYDKYNQYLPKTKPKKLAILTIPVLIYTNLTFYLLEYDAKYREMRSILALRYEEQILQIYPKLKEIKIKHSGQSNPQGNFRDLPYMNPNNYQPNYGNNYNQSFQQPNFNAGSGQNYQQPNFNPEQPFQQPNFSTENTQPYQQSNFRTQNGNPQPYSYQPSNFNERGNYQPNSYQPNTINRNPQPYNYEKSNFDAQNNAQPFQQSNFNAPGNTQNYQQPNFNNNPSSYYQQPNNWTNANPWNNERGNTYKSTEFSDSRNDLSSQTGNSDQLNPNENPYLSTAPKHYPNSTPITPPSKGGYI